MDKTKEGEDHIKEFGNDCYRTTGVQNDILAVLNKWMIALDFGKVNCIEFVTSNKAGGFLSPLR
jgi:hypothetical protein